MSDNTRAGATTVHVLARNSCARRHLQNAPVALHRRGLHPHRARRPLLLPSEVQLLLSCYLEKLLLSPLAPMALAQ